MTVESKRYIRGINPSRLDALRLELSPLPPKDESRMRGEIAKAHKDFLRRFGSHIPSPLSDKAMDERFIFMEEADRKLFENEWYLNDQTIRHQPEEQIEMTTVIGRFVFGVPQLNAWDDDLSKSQRKEALKILQGYEPEEIKNFFNIAYRYKSNTHEISHFYQSLKLPLLFAECGALYYARTLLAENAGVSLYRKEKENAADFYQGLLDRYGDDVHRLFFGTITSNKSSPYYSPKAVQIQNEWTAEVEKRLFPNDRIVRR